MQRAVECLVGLGPLPSSEKPDIQKLKTFEEALSKVTKPVSDEDARALVSLFGPDDCFGAAWTLLHLIETAPNWPLCDCLEEPDNEWIIRLRQRAERGRGSGRDG
jgi:hypothetical protein